MKHLPKIFAFALMSLGAGVLVAHAQGYVPLAPLPIGEGGATPSSYTMSSYLSGAIKLLIALGVGLAVLFAIIGGTQYVAASINPSAKKDAMERIQHAIIGLTIILTSYLLLNSINPKLVSGGFVLPPITFAPTAQITPTVAPNLWASDASERAALSSDPNSVPINKQNCVNIGDTNCTSVLNLQQDVISKIKSLKSACGCSVVVTGGTEYWLHQTHSNNRTVDLSKNSAVDAYITSGISSPGSGCGIRTAPHYQKDFATYVNEGDHWHVCY